MNTKSPERIVATVQPYSSVSRYSSTPNIELPLLKQCTSIRMDESGVFDSDCSLTDTSMLSIEQFSQSTQTDVHDNEYSIMSQVTNTPTTDVSADLCAEIQKLNKFRKIIEERGATQSVKPFSTAVVQTSSAVNTQRLDYYKDRLQLLENKLLVYESSGDVQTKRLAKRLQREIQLEAWVKDLTQRVEKLAEKNRQLEEEKCEFEEAENDARLLLQRLEIDLEMLKQRNIELEISRDTSKSHASGLQDTINDAQDKIYLLEEEKEELRHKIDMLSMFMPAMILFYSWKNRSGDSITMTPRDSTTMHHQPDARELELLANIAELNRAYNETLESADNLWAQMEKEYKEKLTEAEDDKSLLLSKMRMLEERMRNDQQCAHERIVQLEESELILKQNLMKLSRDLKNDVVNFEQLSVEFSAVQEQCAKLNEYLQGPAAEMLEKERRKVQNLITELKVAKRTHTDLKEAHKKQMHTLRGQISKINKNLMHTTVSNGELKEEVATLENRLIELNQQHGVDVETIKNLSIELKSKHMEVSKIVQKIDYGRNLAEELKSATEQSM